MKRILVIGATGNVGRQLIAELPADGPPVRAMVRNPATAALPPHVELVRGNLTEPESLECALDGVESVFLTWTAPAVAVPPALDRIVKCAGRVVFLSSPYKTPHPFFQASQPNAVSALHAEIERRIEGSGREWTFLRPGMFATNALFWWAPQIRSGADVIRWPYADALTAPIHERDIAAVAVRALVEDRHAGAEYVITGPQSLSHADEISAIADTIGRPLRMDEISPEDARRELADRIPPYVLEYLLQSWAAAMGEPAFATSTVAEITGMPARTFREWAADHAADFRA